MGRLSHHLNRRLAAIAFADVAGFSRLMASNEADTVQQWKALRTEILEPYVDQEGGRVAEVAGDALLVEFPSAVNSVRWAVDLQQALAGRQIGPSGHGLSLRIGINVEDVIDDNGLLQGDGVNIAARIHQAAEPGQIVVTAAVKDYVAGRLPVTFHDLGTPPLKNIARPVRVFAVELSKPFCRRLDCPALPTVVHAPDRRCASVHSLALPLADHRLVHTVFRRQLRRRQLTGQRLKSNLRLELSSIPLPFARHSLRPPARANQA